MWCLTTFEKRLEILNITHTTAESLITKAYNSISSVRKLACKCFGPSAVLFVRPPRIVILFRCSKWRLHIVSEVFRDSACSEAFIRGPAYKIDRYTRVLHYFFSFLRFRAPALTHTQSLQYYILLLLLCMTCINARAILSGGGGSHGVPG